MLKGIEQVLLVINDLIKDTFHFVGLGNSNLSKNTKVVINGNRISITAPAYIYFVDEGRKKNARRPPVRVIIKWIKDKNLSLPNGVSIESLAYAIINSISKNGIKAKNFLEKLKLKVIVIIDNYIRIEADKLIKKIVK